MRHVYWGQAKRCYCAICCWCWCCTVVIGRSCHRRHCRQRHHRLFGYAVNSAHVANKLLFHFYSVQRWNHFGKKKTLFKFKNYNNSKFSLLHLSTSSSCMVNFFIWQTIFTNFRMDYCPRLRYNLQANCADPATIAYSWHTHWTFKI